MPGIIIPRKAVSEIQKLIEDPAAEVTVELSTSKIRFTFGTVVLTTKLIDGTFPDYARVIPAGNDKHLTVEKGPFAQAVDRVSTISSERGRAVKLAIADGKLVLSVNTPTQALPPRNSTSITMPLRSISVSTPSTCSTSRSSSTATQRCSS